LERRFNLTTDDIAGINPNTKTAPVFRSRVDAELTAKIYARVPVLISEAHGRAGNHWGVSFMTMFHMSNDSGLFRTAAQLEADGLIRDNAAWLRASAGCALSERWLPLYESKMFDQYNHRYADYSRRHGDRGHRVLPELSDIELADPLREAEPYYWVSDTEVRARCPTAPYLMGYGEATTASTYRTFVTTIIPYSGVGHKTILYFTSHGSSHNACLTANFNSLILDYVARTKVSYLTLAQFIANSFRFCRQQDTLAPNSVSSSRAFLN
jgi:hypothetical protein